MEISKFATNSIKKSTQEFIKNPELVKAQVEFCDSLLEEGYCLKEAIEKTDCVFEILKKEETYKIN